LAEATLIGLDIGTTALKAVLMRADGERLASSVRPYAVQRPAPGHAEQRPADWWNVVVAALGAFAEAHDLSGLAAIGLSSQVNTHVFVDATGAALMPAITWQDGRAADAARALDGGVSHADKLRWFGAPIPIDASHALSRIAYVAAEAPELFARARYVLAPRDYVLFHLTGEIAADPISAVGLVDGEGYVGELLALVPRAAELLPPLHPFTSVAGKVRAGLPCAGIPVVLGTMDAWCGMFGTGVVRDGEAMYQSGTSEIPGIVSCIVNPTPGVITFPPVEGITMHAAPTQSGGAALAWIAQMFSATSAAMCDAAAEIAPSDAVPLFLPHLQGERAPLWDAESRGVFARLDPRAGKAEMARAVLEGVAFSARLAFDALEQSAGLRPSVVHIGGGGSRSDLWCQIRADVLGYELKRVAVPDAAAVGAAIVAGLGVGLAPSLEDSVDRLVRFDKIFTPNPALKPYYDAKFDKYNALYHALRSFNASY
jgi:xylulokinase